MQAILEKREGLKRGLKVTLPGADFKKKHKEVLNKKAQSAKISGFRPGKAPLEVVSKYYGSEIFEKVVDELISTSLMQAFEQEKVYPVNRPNIEDLKAKDGDDFEFTAVFEVAPTVDAVKFDDVMIDKVEAKIKPEDVEKVLTNMQQQFGTYVAKEGPAANNDRVVLDFEGSIDGVKFDGGTATQYPIVLGEGQMIPGFEEGIVGMKAGDEKVLTVTFPENYHADLAGKKADFKIKVHQVETMKPAELNEDFVKRLGVANGDIAELKQEIERTLTRELNKKLRQDLHQLVFDKLAEVNDLELPESVVHEEIHHLMADAQNRFRQMTGKKDVPEFPHEMFADQAKRRVKNSYLILKVIEENQLKADAAVIRTLAEEIAASYENPEQVREYYLNNKDHYRQLESLALEDAVVNYLLTKAKINAIEKAYSEVMGK
jgi:trigger factor